MPSLSAKALQHNLRRLRERHTLTQERVAELSGVDYKFYQAIEAGRRPNVTLSTLDQIAAVYGVAGYKLIGPRLPVTRLSADISPSKRKRSARH